MLCQLRLYLHTLTKFHFVLNNGLVQGLDVGSQLIIDAALSLYPLLQPPYLRFVLVSFYIKADCEIRDFPVKLEPPV